MLEKIFFGGIKAKQQTSEIQPLTEGNSLREEEMISVDLSPEDFDEVESINSNEE